PLPDPLGTGEREPRDGLEPAGYRLETFAVNHGVPAVGYVLVEHDRPGRFDVEAAQALGVPDGPERGVLQHGEPLVLDDGTRIEPTEVAGTHRVGRQLGL